MANRVTNSPVPQQSGHTTSNIPHEKIAKRAYEKWCSRGQNHGSDRQDWMEAEAELRAEAGRTGQTGQTGNQGQQSHQPSRVPATNTMRR